MRMIATAVAILLTTAPVFAQDAKPSLADLATDSAMKEAFDKMAADHQMPDWIAANAVTSSGDEVSFDGKTYLAMSACKQHDCGANAMAVLYEPQEKVMYGVLSTSENDGASEKLEWLNIGGNAESIDGKTLLYATLTGSVTNHPDDFKYTSEATE